MFSIGIHANHDVIIYYGALGCRILWIYDKLLSPIIIVVTQIAKNKKKILFVEDAESRQDPSEYIQDLDHTC